MQNHIFQLSWQQQQFIPQFLLWFHWCRLCQNWRLWVYNWVCLHCSRGAITWQSKRQMFTALSTTKAKYVALSEAAHEAYWPRNLYEELGFKQELPTMIKGNNNGSITMARNPQFHNHTKHITIRYHRVWDAINKGIIKIDSCCDPEQTANILMKALHCFKHQKHVAEMGMKSTLEGTWIYGSFSLPFQGGFLMHPLFLSNKNTVDNLKGSVDIQFMCYCAVSYTT